MRRAITAFCVWQAGFDAGRGSWGVMAAWLAVCILWEIHLAHEPRHHYRRRRP